MQGLMVTKRNGRQEKIDLDKIHRVIDWAAEGLENVSVWQYAMASHILCVCSSSVKIDPK